MSDARATDPARFAVLCSTPTLAVWQANCVEQLLSAGFDCVGVALVPPQPSAAAGMPRKLALGDLTATLADRVARRRCAQLRRRDLRAFLPDVPVMPQESWHCARRLDDDHGERSIDFILRFDDVALPASLPWTPRHGVCWFDHDGPGGLRPDTGLSAHHHRRPVCRTALRRVGGIDGEETVLCVGAVRTHWRSLARTRDDLLRACDDWVLRWARALAAGIADAVPEVQPSLQEERQGDPAPTLRRAVADMVHATVRGTVGRARAIGIIDRWNVGLVDAPIASFLDPAFRPEPRWLPAPPRGWFLADPCALPQEGPDLDVLAEEFDYSTQVGRIVRLRLPASGPPRREVVELGNDQHMSYPFPIAVGGETYCLAECHQSAGVPIWKVGPWGRAWERMGSMLTGLPLVDPTVFEFGSRWWLLAADEEHSPEAKLYAWYGDSPLGPWRPHPLNPIKTDARSSRPAGTPFWRDGRLYRPAQDCSRVYGGAVALNEVLALDVDRFEERVVTVVPPFPGRYPHGIHTLNPTPDGRTLVDGNRHVVSVRVALRRVLLELGKRVRGGAIAGGGSEPCRAPQELEGGSARAAASGPAAGGPAAN